MGRYLKEFTLKNTLTTVGFIGTIATIFGTGSLITFFFIFVLASGIILNIFRIFLPKKEEKPFDIGKNLVSFSAWDSLDRVRSSNSGIRIKKYIRNVELSHNRKLVRVTYILSGKITKNHVNGVHLIIGGTTESRYNDQDFQYYLYTDTEVIEVNDSWRFGNQVSRDMKVENSYYAIEEESSRFTKVIYLPFQKKMNKHENFQIFFGFTWGNTDDSNSLQSVYSTDSFPGGIDMLITNIVTSSKLRKVEVYKIEKKRKKQHLIDNACKISKEGDNYIVTWEYSKPKGDYILVGEHTQIESKILN